jgi:hypothetical protein
MPRDLKQTDRNEMKIDDAISGCDLVLYYRQPTTQERIDFQRASFSRKGKKVIVRTPEARAEFGALVLTGIRPGDFSAGTDDSGKPILIASDPDSPDYTPNWKDQVVATAGDLLMLLGMQVFEGSMQALMKNAAPDVDDEDDEETVLPLATSSNG